MSNNLIFLIQALVGLSFFLFAFKLGKKWLIALMAASVVLMNIFVTKQMDIFGLTATGGNILYAVLFLGTDLLSEHYGKKSALRAVWIGFYASIFFLVMTQMVRWYTPNAADFAQSSFDTLFATTPRIVFASMVAYLVSQTLDVHLFQMIKNVTNNRFLWLRNNGSTIVSQFIDSTLFTTIAFYGVFPAIGEIIIFTWIIKMIVALLDTPFMYLSKLKPFKPIDL